MKIYSPRFSFQVALSRFAVLMLLSAIVGWPDHGIYAQEQTAHVAVRGRLQLPARFQSVVSWQTLDIRLIELIELPPVPLPTNWAEFTGDQRRAWWEEFRNSDRGREFIHQQEELAARAVEFKIRPEPDGSFQLFDVKPGVWGLLCDSQVSIDSRSYQVELEAEISVGEQVDEIQLGEIQLRVIRNLAAGDPVPNFEQSTLSGETISPSSFSHKSLFVSFCDPTSEQEVQFQRELLKAFDELKSSHAVEWVVVLIAPQMEGVEKVVWEFASTGAHFVCVESIDHPLCSEFGIRRIPDCSFIDAQGVVGVSSQELLAEFRRTDASLRDILSGILQRNHPVDRSK
ncbi:MAG TPA: hypothetical protein PKD54_04265 [Pirellulaceae bacterium]|nr:hypothetical protein [Pirellulaceae bacterium]